MLERIKRRTLKKRTDQYITKRDISRINTEMITLGFLVDEAMIPELEVFDSFSLDYRLQPKDVKVFSFQEVKRKMPSLRQNQINNKDFSWKGEIQNQNAIEFLDRKFDVLVGYYSGKHEFLDLMVSRSNAAFKVGFPGGDERLFDLIIAVEPTNVGSFKAELKKYLTVLGKMS